MVLWFSLQIPFVHCWYIGKWLFFINLVLCNLTINAYLLQEVFVGGGAFRFSTYTVMFICGHLLYSQTIHFLFPSFTMLAGILIKSYACYLSWENIPLFLVYWDVFVWIMNGCCILSNAFSACIDIIMWFFFFSLSMCQITLVDFQILSQTFITW